MPSTDDEKTDPDHSLDESLITGVGSPSGVQEKLSHSGGSPGDAGMIVQDEKMSFCLMVMKKTSKE